MSRNRAEAPEECSTIRQFDSLLPPMLHSIAGMAQNDGRRREDIAPGARVRIVQKQDQATGETTEGIVRDILTKSSSHPHGIKVRLETGEVGRVKAILD